MVENISPLVYNATRILYGSALEDYFNIYIDRLKSGGEEKIEFSAPSTFMDINDDELSFEGNIDVKGKAYLTEEHLILHLDIHAQAKMPCKMCNEPKPFSINLEGFYHTQALSEVKEAIFSIASILRDAILLEVPNYYECKLTECEGKKLAQKFLNSQESKEKSEDDVYHPFANLE